MRRVLGATLVVLALSPASAVADPSCSFDLATRTVTVTTRGDFRSLVIVGADGSITVRTLGTSTCDGATTSTADTIAIVAGAGRTQPASLSLLGPLGAVDVHASAFVEAVNIDMGGAP